MEAAEKHHHVHAHEEHEEHINIVTLVAGIVVFIVAIILKFTTHIGIWNTVLFLAAYLIDVYCFGGSFGDRRANRRYHGGFVVQNRRIF